MKTLIMYYSFGGMSKKKATLLKDEIKDAELCEIHQKRKFNIFTAIILGCPSAMKRKTTEIQDIQFNLDAYERIILIAPIWAGYPAPAFNAMVQLLPGGKSVEVYLCSGGGETPKSKEGTCEAITHQGCICLGYHDVKQS
jgi:flavodoxin